MAIPITIPRLGWNMEEGTFAGWLKPDGAEVRAGEPLFRLEGDKATEEVECLETGIVRYATPAVEEGEKVLVGRVIGFVEGEAATSRAEEPAAEVVEKHASPRARRVARELGVDWTTLAGTGSTGRVREQDVRAAAPSTDDALMPLTAIRQTIARRMRESHLTTAPVTLTTTADATNLVNLRDQFRAVGDAPPSYSDFLLKLTALALGKHPLLNAHLTDAGIVPSRDVHLGLAVDTDAGLLVPVVRDVMTQSLRQIATTTRDLITRARQGQLAARDLHGATFTVTNLGPFGIDAFTPLIDLPQCAILGVGRIRKVPLVHDDRLVPRDQLTLSLTFDHRLVDGAPAARFLQTLVGLIENPGPGLMS